MSIQPWLDWNTWALLRPRLNGWFEMRSLGIGMDIGNGVSDPLVSVGVEIKLRRPRLAKWLDWLLPDRRGSIMAKGWCHSR